MSKAVEIENHAELGLKSNKALMGAGRRLPFELTFVWWGQSQWFKWRWNGTHADLGWFSIYGINNRKAFAPLKWAMKPMRWAYHRRFKGVQPHE